MKQFLPISLLTLVFLSLNSIALFAQFDKDLQISNWGAPKTKGALTNSEAVRFNIMNLGTVAASNFTVGFSQDNGVTFKEEIITTTINPGGSLWYTFTSNFAIVGTDGATYSIIGKITYDGDEDLSNNELTEEVFNYLPGDVDDEPIEITSFPYTDSKEYIMYTGNYGPKFAATNYMQEEDIVYSFTTTESQMYVDATVTAIWAGSISPRPLVTLINEKPSTFDKNYPYSDVELGLGYGDWSGSFENGYCYAAQSYYLVVDKWRDYSCSYNLEVNLYRQHDFKFFNLDDLSVEGDIDYENRIVTLTVPKETNITALVPTFELPNYTQVLIDGNAQTSGNTAVDFTNDVTYTINQTITPNATQTWTVKVVEETITAIKPTLLQNISIAPNPAKDKIKIISEETLDLGKVCIYNTTGAMVISKVLNNEDATIAVAKLVPGIYFLQIESEGERIIKKFIKK